MAAINRKRTAHSKDPSRSKKPTEDREAVEVVCRITPFSGLSPCLFLVDESLVKCVAPVGVVQRNGQPCPEKLFEFGYVFDETDTQKAVFERCSLDLIQHLITARSALLFTYGVTGSGKTYTMMGNNRTGKCGLLPRTLDTIFNSIDNQAPKCIFMPVGRNGYAVNGEKEAAEMRRASHLDISSDIDERYPENTRIPGYNDDYACAVFVSYVEIYNNACFDLLGELEDGSLPRCEVREDMSRVTYVDGAAEVEVASADEALSVLVRGDERRRKSDTLLNAESSRSHSIFSIRLVMAPCQGLSPLPVADSSKIEVGQLILVDLAGSERQKRTHNMGERLNEAGKINQSLMALRQCIQKLRSNQRGGRPEPVPYRDTKLTYLFKSFFEGSGKIRMIICANPRPDDYEENLNVMAFAEESQAVTVTRAEERRLLPLNAMRPPVPRRFYSRWNAEMDAVVEGLDQLRTPAFSLQPLTCDLPDPSDSSLISALREQLRAFTTANQQETDTINAAMADLLPAVSSAMCTLDYQREELEKTQRQAEEAGDAQKKTQAQARQLKRENDALRDRLAAHEAVNEEMVRSEENMRRSRREEKERRRQHMDTLEQALGICEGSSSPSVAELRSRFAPHMETSSKRNNTTTTIQSSSSTESRRQAAREVGKAVAGPGFYNPKYHRRSKSAPRIVDHQPLHRVPTGGVLKAALPSNTRHTTRPESHHLKDSSNYLLTHQEVNENGDIDTSIFKGECIPTAGGGTAVCFNDIERVTHESPSKSTRL